MRTTQGLCFFLMYVICAVNSARILGIVHMPAYSHFQLGDRIFRELAARGHEVTVISPFELKIPAKNIKHVVITGFLEEIDAIKVNFFTSTINPILKNFWLSELTVTFTETVLKHPNIQNLLKSSERFDLVIYENFFNEAFSGFAHHYKVPYVIMSTMGASRWTNSKMGNPTNPAYIPDPMLSYGTQMNFCERLLNSLSYLLNELIAQFRTLRKQNELVQKYFPGAPHLNDLMYNASLMLLNSHPSLGVSVPLVPNMIEIGGYHVQPSKPLPKDLQDFLDGAKDGVIFFSMGSNMNSKDMSEEKRDAIINSFQKLKQKVLWKWEDDVLPGQPSNVKLGKWLPQQDILAHPNIKLFITHGGLLSTIEAIYHGVPVLGVPVFGDQELNTKTAERAGYGLGVPYSELTETTFTDALNKILNNKKYAENAKERSKILHDQQTNPLDRAMYWIEYVMRHRGAPHLRTAALDLSWYQYLLLDVIAVVVITVGLAFVILRKVLKFLCGKKTNVVTKTKKQN